MKLKTQTTFVAIYLKTVQKKKKSPIFHYILYMPLQEQHVPQVWEDVVVVLVGKSSRPRMLNDFRPVSLTSIVMKNLVRLETEQN